MQEEDEKSEGVEVLPGENYDDAKKRLGVDDDTTASPHETVTQTSDPGDEDEGEGDENEGEGDEGEGDEDE